MVKSVFIRLLHLLELVRFEVELARFEVELARFEANQLNFQSVKGLYWY